jgi:deoxyribonuclease-2
MMFVFLVFLLSPTWATSCLDSRGTNLDYWAVIKFPGSTNFVFWDTAANGGFQRPSVAVDEPTSSALMVTLAQLYGTNSKLAYAMYNDESPNGATHESKAHSKGVLAFDVSKNSGFWLTHSLPRFPNSVADGLGSLPDSTYAQHFFCVSIDRQGFEDISRQMAINGPSVYDHKVPSTSKASSPFEAWVSEELLSSRNSSVVGISSKGGASMTSFAKSKTFGLDLWDSLVSSNIETDIIVQTWKNGDGINFPSSCSSSGYEYQVMNLEEVQSQSFSWKVTKDHSKWAVSCDSTAKTVCFGDNNRQVSQTKRGGGAVCVQDESLWSAMNSITGLTEQCPVSLQ